MTDRLPYHNEWEILVLGDSLTEIHFLQALSYMNGMFPQFPPPDLSLNLNFNPIEGVDYVMETYTMGGFTPEAPKPTRMWTGIFVSETHPAWRDLVHMLPCEPGKWVHPSQSTIEDLSFAIYHMLPRCGLSGFTDMEYISSARQYLYDNGIIDPEFVQKAWAMIYMYWRVNHADSLFPSLPVPAHVEPQIVGISPTTGNIGEKIAVNTLYKNIGETDKTVPTYYKIIAHNQYLVASGHFEPVPAGQVHSLAKEYTITEAAYNYQQHTPVTICTNISG